MNVAIPAKYNALRSSNSRVELRSLVGPSGWKQTGTAVRRKTRQVRRWAVGRAWGQWRQTRAELISYRNNTVPLSARATLLSRRLFVHVSCLVASCAACGVECRRLGSTRNPLISVTIGWRTEQSYKLSGTRLRSDFSLRWSIVSSCCVTSS